MILINKHILFALLNGYNLLQNIGYFEILFFVLISFLKEKLMKRIESSFEKRGSVRNNTE